MLAKLGLSGIFPKSKKEIFSTTQAQRTCYFNVSSQQDEEITGNDTDWIHTSYPQRLLDKFNAEIARPYYKNSPLEKLSQAYMTRLTGQHVCSEANGHNFMLTPEQEENTAKLIYDISAAASAVEKIEKEYHAIHSAHEGSTVDVIGNSYDNEVFIKILIAAKTGNRRSFVVNMAKLASCFPSRHKEAKFQFIKVFAHLFETGHFPSLESEKYYCALVLGNGQIGIT